MALTSSPNEPTLGSGGKLVVDQEGHAIGHVLPPNVADAPSEDLARVAVELEPDVVQRYSLEDTRAEFEATWLRATDKGDYLVLDRPVDVALREQGFEV